MPVAFSQQGPFSVDTFILTTSTATDQPANRTFTLANADFDPLLSETLEVTVNGVKLSGDGSQVGASSTGHEFYVDSATNPTTVTIETNTRLNAVTDSSITAISSGDVLKVRRISNRTTKNVDYAPGSVIRETDLDNSNTQIMHVAQEAIDIALNSIQLDGDNKFNANDGISNRVLKNLADGSVDTDAVNKGQLSATETTTLAYKEDAEDYKLEAKDWADKVDAGVKAYTDNSQTGSVLGYSAKEYAQGDGNSDAISTGGSAKGWAQDTAKVNGATTNDRSAKAWAQGASMTGATLGGSAKDWAQLAEDSQVNGSEYSAKHYSAKSAASATAASASEVAARNSANSVTNILDNFGDKYLGTMSSSDTATTASITGAKWVKGGSQITNVTQASGTIEEGQVLTNDGSATGWPTTATVRIIDYNSGTSTITINQVFTEAQTSGETLTGTGYGVYGAYDTNKEGPAKDNDNGNLIDGALYFDTTNSVNSMRVYDLGNTKWVKATSSGTVSISEFKFTATAGQTTFTGSADSGGTLAYSTSNLIVTLNGVVMENGADYTASNGTSVVLSSGAALNDELNVIAFKSFETSDMVSATNGGTFNGNVSFGDNNITNVGDISLDTISSDAGTSIGVTLGTDAGDDFNVGSGKLLVEGDTGLVSIGTGGDFETSTTGKVKQKGAFMQSSTNQAMVLGG